MLLFKPVLVGCRRNAGFLLSSSPQMSSSHEPPERLLGYAAPWR